MRTTLTSPSHVEVYNRFGEVPATVVDWCPTDTVADVLERAGFDLHQVTGAAINSQYVRGIQTEPVWPNSTIVVDTI